MCRTSTPAGGMGWPLMLSSTDTGVCCVISCVHVHVCTCVVLYLCVCARVHVHVCVCVCCHCTEWHETVSLLHYTFDTVLRSGRKTTLLLNWSNLYRDTVHQCNISSCGKQLLYRNLAQECLSFHKGALLLDFQSTIRMYFKNSKNY